MLEAATRFTGGLLILVVFLYCDIAREQMVPPLSSVQSRVAITDVYSCCTLDSPQRAC